MTDIGAVVKNFFNDPFDIVHFILGLLTYLLMFFVSNWLALILFLIYIIYQTLENEDKLESTADIVEFFVGFAVGFLIVPV